MISLVYFLFIYISFEGFVRRFFPYHHQFVLLFKDLLVMLMYVWFLSGEKIHVKESIKTFGLWFPCILLVYGMWNMFGVLNPSNPGLLPALIGLKLNMLYLPLVFVGCYVSMDDRFRLRKFIRVSSWPVFIVLFYGLIQIFTGFDTIIDTGITRGWSELGGDVRIIGQRGEILIIASTLYGGLLSPYGLIWFVIILSIILSGPRNDFYGMTVLVSSILLMLFAINRTVMVSAVIIIFVNHFS